MLDSTRRRWVCLGAAVAMLVALAAPSLALADGDPASDVLAGQALYLPADSGASAGEQATLAAAVAAAVRVGVPLRVAVIAGRSDLGSVGALWRQPAPYARFLGLELSLVFRGTLLVAMPHGFGAVRVSSGGVTPLPSPAGASGPDLAAATVSAVRRLAAADGHPLPALSAGAGRGSSGSGVDLEAVVALVLGLMLIAGAWTASLRARPLRRRDPVA